MRAIRLVSLGFPLLFAALAGAGCKRLGGCPDGMVAVASRSVEGKSLLCKSRDGATYRWLELQRGTSSPRQACRFTGGKLEGEYAAHHPNGKPWVVGRYVDGQKSGVWTQYDAAGRKVAEGEYRRDRLVGGAPVAMSATCDKVEL